MITQEQIAEYIDNLRIRKSFFGYDTVEVYDVLQEIDEMYQSLLDVETGKLSAVIDTKDRMMESEIKSLRSALVDSLAVINKNETEEIPEKIKTVPPVEKLTPEYSLEDPEDIIMIDEDEEIPSELQETIETLKDENAVLLEENNKIKVKQSILISEKDQLKSAQESLHMQIEKMKAAQESLRSQNTEIQAERDTLRSQNTEIQAERDTLRSQNTEIQAERDTLRSQINSKLMEQKKLHDELEKINSERERQAVENDELQSKNQTLEAQLARVNKICLKYIENQKKLISMISHMKEKLKAQSETETARAESIQAEPVVVEEKPVVQTTIRQRPLLQKITDEAPKSKLFPRRQSFSTETTDVKVDNPEDEIQTVQVADTDNEKEIMHAKAKVNQILAQGHEEYMKERAKSEAELKKLLLKKQQLAKQINALEKEKKAKSIEADDEYETFDRGIS